MALLVVLVLVMMAAYSAYTYAFHMESQYRTARVYEEQLHAQAAALSGAELVAAVLELPLELRNALGGVEHNSALFQHRLVQDMPLQSASAVDQPLAWRVSMLTPHMADGSKQSAVPTASSRLNGQERNFDFGLENESAKIPLQALIQWDQQFPGHAVQSLLSLPGATAENVAVFLSALGIQSSNPKNPKSNLLAGSATQEQSASQEQIYDLWIGGDLNQNYRLDALDLAWTARQRDGTGLATGASAEFASPLYRGATNSATRRAGMATNNQASSTEPGVSGGGDTALGWQRFLSWSSGSRNVNKRGQRRIDLNQPNLRLLHQQLVARVPSAWADYIVLYRQYGGSSSGLLGSTSGSSTSGVKSASVATVGGSSKQPASPPNIANQTTGGTTSTTLATAVEPSSSNGPPNLSIPASATIASPLALIGAITEVPSSSTTDGKSTKRRVQSPFLPENGEMMNYLGVMLDELTTQPSEVMRDRIDVNSASLPVLMAIPGMDTQTADAIWQRRQNRADRRDGTENSSDGTIAWLVLDGVLDLPRLISMEKYLCGRSDVYSCQAIGYRDDRSAVYRCTFTVDACQNPASLQNFQTWHAWDRGFSIDQFSSLTR